MKKEYLFLIGFVLLLAVSVSTTLIYESATEKPTPTTQSPVASGEQQVVIPQLQSEERESSATMVLLGAPPLQPADHINRWVPELHHESCLTCHAIPESTGAREIPEDHYYDNNRSNAIFRDNCVQCHGEQNDTKTAFNEE